MLQHILDMSYVLLARAPIVMFINIYAGELPIRKTCNFDKPLNHIFKVRMAVCTYLPCKHQNTHNQNAGIATESVFTDSLHEV